MAFGKEFCEKVDFDKNRQTTKKHAKLPSRQRVTGLNREFDFRYKLQRHQCMSFAPQHEETLFCRFANNRGADQPAHPGSLISTIVIAYWKESYQDLLQAKFHYSS